MREPLPLHERLVEGLQSMGPSARIRMAESVVDAAIEAGMWMDDRETGREVPIALLPATIDPAQFGYMHHAAWQLRRALQRLPEIVAEDAAAAELVPLGDEERRWFDRFRSPSDASTSRFCRIDALYRPAPSGENPAQLSFIEPNVVGLGGLCYAVDALEILDRHVFGPHLGDGVEKSIRAADDPRTLLAAELETHLQQHDGDRPAVIALLGSRSGYDTDGEDRRLVESMNERSEFDVLFADPEELEVSGDDSEHGIAAHGRSIDLIYRMMELSDLVEREAGGADLDAMKEAFKRGMVVPTVAGDLEHKSVFELFTDPRFAHHFTRRQRRIFDQHVLWTRLLTERRTKSPAGRQIDLPKYVRRERHRLVLKPNRSYGGSGVVLGPQTAAREWDRLVDTALEDDDQYVVQQLAPLVREQLPVVGDSGFDVRDVYTVVGVFPSPYGCGLLGRYAEEGVVNVSRSGGVVAYGLDFT